MKSTGAEERSAIHFGPGDELCFFDAEIPTIVYEGFVFMACRLPVPTDSPKGWRRENIKWAS